MKYLDSELEALGYQLQLAETLDNEKIIALNFMIENLTDQKDELNENIKVEQAKVDLLYGMIKELYSKRDSLIKKNEK